MTRSILMLDTAAGNLRALTAAFEASAGKGGEVSAVDSSAALLERIRRDPVPDMIVLDWFLGDGRRRGAEILSSIRSIDRDTPVVVVAERGDVESVAEAIRAGATDFLVRGEKLEERVATLMRKAAHLFHLEARNRALASQAQKLRDARYHIVGYSPQIRDVMSRIERMARIPRPVLITGERGTGKELVARAIHAAGGPVTRPMVSVNCAALSEALLESELFGHERGAFTGAHATVAGKFEQADGGTLFLDEVGGMSLPFQQKILRAVEYGAFTRVGGSAEIQVSTRIIAATNADLEEKMRAGEFLRDLYDRLAFEVIRVPPLRERADDIEALAKHFLEQFMLEIPSLRGKRLSRQALESLRGYSFPGNLRELKNIIERAACRETAEEISPEDLELSRAAAAAAGGSFTERIDALERALLLGALRDAGGNRAEAARRLGLSYHQFRHYARKHSV